jgi:hypothetical protein
MLLPLSTGSPCAQVMSDLHAPWEGGQGGDRICGCRVDGDNLGTRASRKAQSRMCGGGFAWGRNRGQTAASLQMFASATCAEGRTNDGGDDAELLTILSAVPMSSCTASQCAPLAATEGDDAEDRAAEIDLAHWAVNWGGLGGGGPHLEPGRRISASNCSQA